jgi:hypothetical protein
MHTISSHPDDADKALEGFKRESLLVVLEPFQIQVTRE